LFISYIDRVKKDLQDLLQILEGCCANDHRCQKAMYDRYLSYVMRISFRYVHSFDNASIAANDAFVRIFKNIKKFEIRDPDNLEKMLMGWIRRLAINASIDYMSRENLVPETTVIPESVWQVPGGEKSGEEKMMYKELITLVRRLSPAYRVVFNLHVIDGYSHQEIASMLGISVGTSKSNLSKAKIALKKYFIQDKNGNTLCFT